MKVKRNTLLLLACLVWSAAGFNILRIGLMAYPAYGTVFIALRASGLAPERFIAVFYTGLGAALLLAGVLFGRNYGRAVLTAAGDLNKAEQEGV